MNFFKKNWWIAAVVIIVMFSMITLYFLRQQELTATSGKKIDSTTFAVTEPQYDLVPYINEDYQYTAQIPSDWKKVIKDGYDTFIHSPTATSCQIQTLSYDPSLLLVTSDSLQQELSNAGYILNNFQWTSATQYSVIYQKIKDDNNSCIYIEITDFDRNTALRRIYMTESKYYDDFNGVIIKMIDEFAWDKQNPFPEGYVPYYSTVGNFEFVYPDGWNIGENENTYLMQCPEYGSTISINATKSTATYGNVDKLDYTSYASESRQNFMLLSYNADSNLIVAESSFVSNNTEMRMVQYLIATGTYEYTITFETPASVFNQQSEFFSNVVDCFRYFK